MRWFFVILFSLVFAGIGFASYIGENIDVRLLHSDIQRVEFQVRIGEYNLEKTEFFSGNWVKLVVPDMGFLTEEGKPALPHRIVRVGVPEAARYEVTATPIKTETLCGVDVVPFQNRETGFTEPKDFLMDTELYSTDSFFPDNIAEVSDIAVMRGLRVLGVRLTPVRYNPAKHTVEIATVFRVKVRSISPNPDWNSRLLPGEDYERMVRNIVINYDYMPKPVSRQTKTGAYSGGKYLIITAPTYSTYAESLYQWKFKKGLYPKLVTTSETGTSSSSIKSYIQDAYDSWDIPPEYVVFVGDVDGVPTGNVSYWATDNYYATLEGDDDVADIFVGRLSCDNSTDALVVTTKQIIYETEPPMSDPDWFKRATLFVREDNDGQPSDTSYVNTTMFIKDKLLSIGYDTISYYHRNGGDDADDVFRDVNWGITFMNFRGQSVVDWWPPFGGMNPDAATNGAMMPVILSVTCGTGDYADDDHVCETWTRAHNGGNLSGAVAFYGSTEISSNVHERSALHRGFYVALCDDDIHRLGVCMVEGKNYMFDNMGVNSYTRKEYYSYNILGDPELCMWTDTPQELDVSHPPIVGMGHIDFPVSVTSAGSPVSGALVCCYMDSTVYETGYTGADGSVNLSLDIVNFDTLNITVTKPNYLKYEGFASPGTEGPYAIYYDCILDDSSGGNGDGMLNPGERVELYIIVKNYGSEQANGVWARLTTDDSEFVTINVDSIYLDRIPYGGEVTSEVPFEFEVSSACTSFQVLHFTVTTHDNLLHTWEAASPNLTVAAARISVVFSYVDDAPPHGNGDGLVWTGETPQISFAIHNDGQGALDGGTLKLRLPEEYAFVVDSVASFPPVDTNETVSNDHNPFATSINPEEILPDSLPYTLFVFGNGGTYPYIDTLTGYLPCGGSEYNLPVGPDSYGYYCYDDTDTLTGHAPSYSWVEISSTGSAISAITDRDDDITTIPLPFTFKYYGIDYENISVCTNGFLALGTETWSGGSGIHEHNIPHLGEAKRIVAPFWDDLDLRTSSGYGDVYQYTDEANHRFIIEYKEAAHYGYPYNRETFEVILYDPGYYPTPTGDGEIVFQYQDIDNASSNAVGIEDHTETIGIQYLYHNSYAENAEPLIDGRAIKFTTYPPEELSPSPWIYPVGLAVSDPPPGGNGNGFVDQNEDFGLVVSLKNGGGARAYMVNATLSSTADFVTVDRANAFYGTISPGFTVANDSSPFSLSTGVVPQDTTIQLELCITADPDDYTTTVTIELSVYVFARVESNRHPDRFYLSQNYPNPFNPETRITVSVPEGMDRATLEIFNLLGEKIKQFELPTGGTNSLLWDGKDEQGTVLPSGLYLYRLTAGEYSETKKMLLLR